MPSAGSVHVDVLPDLKRFGPQLRSQLTQIGKRAGRDSGNASGGEFAKRWAAKVNAIPDPEITVTANTGVAMTNLAAVSAAADRLDGRTVTIDVKTRGARGARADMTAAGRSGGQGGSGGGRGQQRPFTDMSPAASLAAWTVGPAAVPSVAALTGALGALASGFGAATAGGVAFGAAVVPALTDVAEVTELQKQAAKGGAEATAEYQEALAGLTPAARNTVTAWGSLTSAYDEWQRSLQSDTLPVVTRGIGLLESQLPSLTPIVRSSARGFDSLLDSSEAALNGPHWGRFTSFAARQAEPSIGILGRSVGNLAVGFTGLLVSFEPLWAVMGPGMEDLTRRFAAWSNESSNFTGFISWVISEGPTFVGAFTAIAGAAIDVGVALAPLGTVYAQGLTVLAQAISAVAEEAPWLIQAAVAAGTLRMALSLLGRVHTGLIQPLNNASTRVSTLTTRMRTAATAGITMRGALSGVSGVLGGPWGIALAAATVGLGLYISKKQQATAKTQEYTDAIKADSGALSENTRQVAIKALEDENALESAEMLGLSMKDVTDAALGQSGAMSDLNDTLRERQAELNEQEASGEITLEQYRKQTAAIENLRESVTSENTAISESVAAHERQQEAAGATTEQQNQLNNAMAGGAYQARDFKTALDSLTGSNISAVEAEIAYEAAVDRATEAVRQNGHATDLGTEAGRKNRDTLVQLSDASRDHLAEMKANEEGSFALRKEQEKQRKKFVQVARQMGYTKKEAQDLADEYLGIPDEINTALEVNASGSWKTLENASPGHIQGYATGGPVFGAGTATSDSIPAMLSDGEFVQPTGVVDYYGPGFMEALRHRAIPREALPGYATGGTVTTRGQGSTPWDRIDDHRLDTLREHKAMVDRLTTLLGDHMGEQWAKAMKGPQGVVRLAEASIGKYPESGGNNTNDITRWYGMSGAPWCAMFISWLFAQAGASKALKGASRTAWTGDYYTSGMRRAGNPMPGDVAVYGTRHVNLVASMGGGKRIGGNQSNNVTSGGGYGGGSIFRPDWGAVGFAKGGLADVMDQDRREDDRRQLGSNVQLLRGIAGLAGGGTASGWTVVGEEGPELARFDDPARIYSNQESARMVAESRRAGSQAAGGDGASSPLIGEYHQHFEDGESAVRQAMGELTHTLRVVSKGGLYSG